MRRRRNEPETLAGFASRCLAPLLGLAFCAGAQNPVRVLFLGGADNAPAHNPTALRDTLAPVLAAENMTLAYRDTQTVLNADSLRNYDVILLSPADHGSGTAGGSNLTTAQEDALIGWLDAGHVAVALHGSTNTYLNNPRWLKLLGAEFLDHGSVDNAGAITFTRPTHPALAGTTAPPVSAAATGGQPYWDEGRRHKNFVSDTVVLATAHLGGGETVPWIWVRPQGAGWVYYNASGHDGQAWKLAQWKGQVVQALRWGAMSAVSLAPRRPGSLAQAPLRASLSFPAENGGWARVLSLDGRTLSVRTLSAFGMTASGGNRIPAPAVSTRRGPRESRRPAGRW